MRAFLGLDPALDALGGMGARTKGMTVDVTDAGRGFQAEDILKQAMIQEVTVAPDGSSIVFSRRVIIDGKYRKHLWRVGLDGEPPEQLTSVAASDSRPRFSPDGRRLLFLSDRSGRAQPWVMPLGGGDPRHLAEFPGHVGAAEWSPDGRRVLVVGQSGEDRFIVGERDDPTARRIVDFTWRRDGTGVRDQFSSLFVVSADGGGPVRLTAPTYEVFQAFWSPDGGRIGFVADLRPEAALGELGQVWAIAVEGGEPEPVARMGGEVYLAAWSSDGVLAMLGKDHPRGASWANVNLAVADTDGTRQFGAALDRSIANTTFGDLVDPESFLSLEWLDATNVVAFVGDGGRGLPYRFGLDGRVERLADGEFVCTSLAIGGGRIVVVASDRGQPGEVYAVEAGKFRQLTTIGSAWLAPVRKDPERLRITHPDGAAFDAWYLPARGNPRPGPLAVQVHGGPHGSHGPTPWLEMLALADAGIHVVYANPRGSAGYGEAFTRSVHGAFGDLDGDDQLRLVDWAIEEGIADPARVGIFGLSYGGFMTNWLLGHAPGRFAAGVSENPLANAISWYGANDLVDWTDERFMGVGRLPEDIETFLKRSPFMEIHRNEAPLLLLQSEQDLRCPPQDSDIIFAILRSCGRTVELIRYPNEPHYLVGIGRPDRRIDRLRRTVEWFVCYL
jgi:acylaminoacyl-peptidase